ncbi:hypothetical protein GKC30_13120 [Pseudodesulfovibrio sp. F-1]|uniref:Uncharacterized protein n=1 Tax=Pseudodesulfovibrio alkaliphilus TaxID=2661613 RepID=A0A7K1KR65_9BACT|nr:hypothetical protein [Pseudodesulfovibrio alkaliphilus]MUM78578.1 hypothetical protein [Pseudodesulfovibrio alkaliphilus]
MAFVIDKHQFSGRVNSLRSMLAKVLDEPTLILERLPVDYKVALTFSASNNAPRVTSKRNENIIMLSRCPKKDISIWVGMSEWWLTKKSECFFDNYGFRFYYCPSTSKVGKVKEDIFQQIIRVECVSWNGSEAPGEGAAHPHFHIDQWPLKDTQQEHRMIEAELLEISKSSEEVHDFSDAFLERSPVDEPNSNWLSRIHFPLQAKWFESRFQELAVPPSPHVTSPASIEELDNWIYSLLSYMKNEFEKYLIKA